MLFFRTLGLITCIMLLFGCVHVTKPISVDASPAEGKAYLYGKFNLSESSSATDIVLIVVDANAEKMKKKNARVLVKKYGLKFNKQQDVYAVAVKPGVYRIRGFEYGTGKSLRGKENASEEAEGLIGQEIRVEENNAYYLGDWYGSGFVLRSYPITHYSWKLDKAEFNYEDTTEKYLALYKNFSTLKFNLAFNLDYSNSLDRNDPETYTLDDLKKAVSYADNNLAFKMAISLQDQEPDAQAYLGYFYEKGIDVGKDTAKSLELYHKSVKRNSAQGMWLLGLSYRGEAAKYESTDSEKAKKYGRYGIGLIERSAFFGNPKAVALQCKVFTRDEATNALKEYGMAWCNIGKKLLNEGNQRYFEDSPAINKVPTGMETLDMDKIAEAENKIIEKMKSNNVVFLR